jgi:hypothetical protein
MKFRPGASEKLHVIKPPLTEPLFRIWSSLRDLHSGII